MLQHFARLSRACYLGEPSLCLAAVLARSAGSSTGAAARRHCTRFREERRQTLTLAKTDISPIEII